MLVELGGALVVHRGARVPLRPSPYRSNPGSIPTRGPMLHVFPLSLPYLLSYSTIKRRKPLKKILSE